MSLLCIINMGFVCLESRWWFSCIISSVIQLDYVVGSYAKIGYSVFSVGSVVFPPRSLVRVGCVSLLGFIESSGIRIVCEQSRVPGCSFSSCIGFSSCEDFRYVI